MKGGKKGRRVPAPQQGHGLVERVSMSSSNGSKTEADSGYRAGPYELGDPSSTLPEQLANAEKLLRLRDAKIKSLEEELEEEASRLRDILSTVDSPSPVSTHSMGVGTLGMSVSEEMTRLRVHVMELEGEEKMMLKELEAKEVSPYPTSILPPP